MIANKYTPMSKIGSGTFGTIYRGKYAKTGEYVAIKTELLDTSLQTLKHETTILNYLHSKGSTHTPLVYWYGIHLRQFTLVIPLYERSLEEMIHSNAMSKIQSMKIVSKMIDILDTIHNLGVLHRDIKPQNFMMRNDDVFLIDFGLSTVYMDDKKVILPQRELSSYMLGTPKFVSIHVHNGEDPTRRDDCISVIYILQYLLLDGHLYWENVQDKQIGDVKYSENHILYFKNAERKRLKSMHFESIQTASILGIILGHLYEMSFIEQPNYQWMRSLLHD